MHDPATQTDHHGHGHRRPPARPRAPPRRPHPRLRRPPRPARPRPRHRRPRDPAHARSTASASSSATTRPSPPTAPSGSPTPAGSGRSRSGRATSSSTPAPAGCSAARPTATSTRCSTGLCFANGVALTARGGCRAGRRDRHPHHPPGRTSPADGGPGATTTWVDDLPGHPDNIALGSDGLVWVTVATPTDPALTVLQKSPRPVRGSWSAGSPSGSSRRPSAPRGSSPWTPPAARCTTSTSTRPRWHLATGVREHHGRVWLGSLVEPAIAVGDVPDDRPSRAPARRPPATSRRAARAAPRASRRAATPGTRCHPPARRRPR